MKGVLLSIFFLISLFSFGQRGPNRKFFPDTLYGVGLNNSFQKEDIYTFMYIQVPITKRLFLHSQIGKGWRHASSTGSSGAAKVGLFYSAIEYKQVRFGPILQVFSESLTPKDKANRFVYSALDFGYRVTFGRKIKLVQESGFGIHRMKYQTTTAESKVNYFGYSIQIGGVYEF
jgi:hypothetical protein